ncbi:LamG-like jellyroll fold domain-containing protein [Brachybacterium sp. GCM10030268]|uniref:LamG-like jellyroll fold domain-containing protein n=1 Tax=Brachybacterium sp. GCM10030268 TaxID=3273382 RepID=UPI0036154B58
MSPSSPPSARAAVPASPMRRSSWLLLALALAATSLLWSPTAPSAHADGEEGSRFSLAVLPDTQFYSRYAQSNFIPDYGTDPFNVQTQWLADHADELNIPFTAHLGDVVDQAGVQEQWEVADQAMATLEEAGMPYSILPGNHDVLDSNDQLTDTDYDLAAEPFAQWFGPERAAQQSTYGGSDPTGLSQFHLFEAEGQQFLVLALPWRASEQTLQWAQGVLDAHPTVPAILTTHDTIAIDTEGQGFTSDYGEQLWDGLIAGNDQIFLTLNGHYHGAAVTTRANDAGHDVTQILIDYQMAQDGGNGYLGLLEFDLTRGGIHGETVSPWVGQKSQDQLTQFDQPALTGPAQSFDVDIDFAERFAGFAPDFGPGEGLYPSLSQRAVDLVTDGFSGVPENSTQEPGSAQDYVRAPGTLAHWRMDAPEGTLEEGAVIEDVVGDSDLHRVSLEESGSSEAQVEDVSIERESQRYSASGSSVCFDDSSRERFSYLSTDPEAAVNNADLSGGYTIETFLKIDEDWSESANAWSKALVRSGNRSQIEGMPWSQWDYTASPTALGVSNLREYQFTTVGQDAAAGDKTAWSGEILPGTWNHVAIVNDPATEDIVMYVNGAPVLRTSQDVLGQSFNESMPWIIGSDWVDDAATNGWHGCVGETRISDRPLDQDQWLTARPDLGTLAVTQQPETAVVAGEDAVLEGTGTPGAEVRAVLPGSGETLSAEVADDGTWTLTVPGDRLSDAETVLTLDQGFGERRSEATEVTVPVEADGNGNGNGHGHGNGHGNGNGNGNGHGKGNGGS